MTEVTELFPSTQPAATEPNSCLFAGIALERGIDRVLDYSIPQKWEARVRVGLAVKVPLGRGNKLARGYVVRIRNSSDYPKIKPLAAVDDDRVLIGEKLLRLARWMSSYYFTPLGVVLESVIPSAVRKGTGVGYTSMVRPAKSDQELQTILEKCKTPKRRIILARLLQLKENESIELARLAGESGVKPGTIRRMAKLGVVQISQVADWGGMVTLPHRKDPTSITAEPLLSLTPGQQQVMKEMQPRVESSGFSVNLLHGVTGSGKTEIYLRCISMAVQAGKQAIVLVPEIALTPQTVRRFTARFDRVAVLHSGLTASERHRQWQKISQGDANVVVGARSAIFAPLPKLGIIVVDEEHEASYKQDSAPRYQARDVAVKRAQLEAVPILLGSATPSLESYWRVSRGTPGDYHLLTLPSRVRNLQMPHVELVDMRQANRFRHGVHLLSERLEHLLKTTVDSGKQAILLLNRRGYSNYVYCPSCTEVIQCKYCDATMTYHRSASAEVKSAKAQAGIHTGQLHCHYCLAVNALPPKCQTCGKKLSLFGLGTQRVEEELARKFPNLKYARVDSDSMKGSKDYEKLLTRFGNGELQVLLGTQMIAKGLDYPNVTLVGVISGDTALALPDFRAAERTFQLITQVAGRAGRGDSPGRVLLQTFLPDDPSIRYAMKQDFLGFAQTELKHRQSVGLPPFKRMVRIIMRNEDMEKLHAVSEQVAIAVRDAIQKVGAGVAVKGPMPCAISRIAGYFRNQLVLTGDTAKVLQAVLSKLRGEKALSKNERVAVDVDPVSLL